MSRYLGYALIVMAVVWFALGHAQGQTHFGLEVKQQRDQWETERKREAERREERAREEQRRRDEAQSLQQRERELMRKGSYARPQF